MTREPVTEISTWPKSRAPQAAASVSGTAWARSVPTSWLAPSIGYTNSSPTIIRDPEPTEVRPTTRPPRTPKREGGSGAGRDVGDVACPGAAATPVEQVAQHHRPGSDEQRGAEVGLDARLRRLGVADQMQQVAAREGGRDRAQHHPLDQPVVHRAGAHVDSSAEGPHQHRRHEIGGDRRGRLDPEEEDEHRGHQRAPAGAGHADQQADDRAAQDDVGIDVHGEIRPVTAAVEFRPARGRARAARSRAARRRVASRRGSRALRRGG